MIMQLPKGDFHPIAVQRKAEPYYQKLLAVPLHKAKQDYDLEIIPYETLWAFMLESLEPDRKTKVRDRWEKFSCILLWIKTSQNLLFFMQIFFK